MHENYSCTDIHQCLSKKTQSHTWISCIIVKWTNMCKLPSSNTTWNPYYFVWESDVSGTEPQRCTKETTLDVSTAEVTRWLDRLLCIASINTVWQLVSTTTISHTPFTYNFTLTGLMSNGHSMTCCTEVQLAGDSHSRSNRQQQSSDISSFFI